MDEVVGAKRTAALKASTPVPNWLLDEVLPFLGDTELRVLLVVVRSTLGWQDGSERKESDWISHRQLQARTGRSSAVVSRAVDALVRWELIAVTDAAGGLCLTAKSRSQAQGRLYYRLMRQGGRRELVLESARSRRKSDSPSLAKTPKDTLEGETLRGTQVPSSEENASNNEMLTAEATRETLPQKIRATKETGTKEIKEKRSEVITLQIPTSENEVSRFDIGDWLAPAETELAKQMRRGKPLENAGEDSSWPLAKLGNNGGEGANRIIPGFDQEISLEMRRFIATFRYLYSAKRPGCVIPPLCPEDYALLRRRLTRHPVEEMEAWLPAFFESSFGYVRRRHWSLDSYLNSLTVLQAAHSSKKR